MKGKVIVMDHLNRRQFIGNLTWLTVASLAWPLTAGAGSGGKVDHPLAPPDPALYGRCPNCGMTQSMWARTWKTFRLADQTWEACSFHCLAEMALKADRPLEDIQTALFLQPRGMVPAEAAWFVVGSSARGTMTQISKAAFINRSDALLFTDQCGGKVMDYSATYASALGTLAKENAMIDKKRLAGKKIVPPVDLKDECVVCHMYPSRYPRFRSQVSDPAGRIDHFCSTHCLFVWLDSAQDHATFERSSAMIWVTDFISGRWISARTAYYVVGSRTMGPMGGEAIAFDRRSQAQEFAAANGGQVVAFHQVKTGASAWAPSS